MASKIWPVLKLATKVTVAGGALYVAYDSGLLGSSEQGTEVLGKAKSAIPPAVNEWLKYFGMETKVPALPTIEFTPRETWNSGVRTTISTLSDGPTKVCNSASQGFQYLKELVK